MRSSHDLTREILKRFKEQGVSQVPGYDSFGYISESDTAVYVTRERGQNNMIPLFKIQQAVKAVREDPEVYSKEPSTLHGYGITRLDSPVWSLLHLLTLDEIIA